MKKDPAGKLYMPLTYKGGKFFIKLGLSPNKVTFINLILSFFIFYGVVMAGEGHTLDLFTQQPIYGSWFIALSILTFQPTYLKRSKRTSGFLRIRTPYLSSRMNSYIALLITSYPSWVG